MSLVFYCLIIFYEMCISVVINLVCCCETLVLADSTEGKKDWRVSRLQYSPRPMAFYQATCPFFLLLCPGEASGARFSFEVSPRACFLDFPGKTTSSTSQDGWD